MWRMYQIISGKVFHTFLAALDWIEGLSASGLESLSTCRICWCGWTCEMFTSVVSGVNFLLLSPLLINLKLGLHISWPLVCLVKYELCYICQVTIASWLPMLVRTTCIFSPYVSHWYNCSTYTIITNTIPIAVIVSGDTVKRYALHCKFTYSIIAGCSPTSSTQQYSWWLWSNFTFEHNCPCNSNDITLDCTAMSRIPIHVHSSDHSCGTINAVRCTTVSWWNCTIWYRYLTNLVRVIISTDDWCSYVLHQVVEPGAGDLDDSQPTQSSRGR